MTGRLVVAALILFGAAATASAQARQRLAPIVVDLRGFTVGFGQDEITIRDLALVIGELPSRGWGGVVAGNVYPLRGKTVSIGASFEALIGRGKRTNADLGGVISVVTRRISGVAGGFSMNFGHRDGFSYIGAGMGPMMFESWTEDKLPDEVIDPPRRPVTLNFGGGARWFTSPRLAFTFDVRFYETKPANTTLTRPGRERRRLLVLSAGISIR